MRRLQAGFDVTIRYFFFSPIFTVGAAAVVFGFSFFGFFASLLLRIWPLAMGRLLSDCEAHRASLRFIVGFASLDDVGL